MANGRPRCVSFRLSYEADAGVKPQHGLCEFSGVNSATSSGMCSSVSICLVNVYSAADYLFRVMRQVLCTAIACLPCATARHVTAPPQPKRLRHLEQQLARQPWRNQHG
jgi:hypothetical protein